jgi:hypothetical protein
VLVLRGSADLARKATLVAQPAGQGLVVYRPEATRPQLRAEPLSAATLSTVLSIFIAWLSTK